MIWIKTFSQKNIYLFSLIVAFMATLLLWLCSFFMLKSSDTTDYGIVRIIVQLIPSLFVFIIIFALNLFDKVGFRKKGFVKGFALGWFGLIAVSVTFVMSYAGISKDIMTAPTIWNLVGFTITMFLVGVFEEILCRGLILNNMLLHWGSNKKGIIKAVLLSSVIFGISHIVNLISSPSLIITTFSQIIYASFVGVFFAGIYLRCRNIWSVIVLHALVDWIALVLTIFLISTPGTDVVDMPLIQGLSYVILCLPLLIIGVLLLRKVEPSDIPYGQ